MKQILSLALLSVISASATTKVLPLKNPSLSRSWSNTTDVSRSLKSVRDEVKKPEYTGILAASIATDFAECKLEPEQINLMFEELKTQTKKTKDPNYTVVKAAVNKTFQKKKVTKQYKENFAELLRQMISMAAEIKASKEEAEKAGLQSTLEIELTEALTDMIGKTEAEKFIRIINRLKTIVGVNPDLSEKIIAQSLVGYMAQFEEIESVKRGLEQLCAEDSDLDNKPKEYLSALQKKRTDELLAKEGELFNTIRQIKQTEQEISFTEESLAMARFADDQLKLIMKGELTQIKREELFREASGKEGIILRLVLEQHAKENERDELALQHNTIKTAMQKINNQIKALKKILKSE